MEKKTVFISHHEDSAGPLAAQIAAALENVGISCWYAPRNMEPGPFRKQIYNAIHDCRVFVLIVNPQIAQSSEVLGECETAHDFYKEDLERVFIVPFLADGCPLPPDLYHFRNFQHIDGSIPTLVKQISRLLNVEPQATSAPPSAESIKRGECGDNVIYTLEENGVLTISGNGPMRDFDFLHGVPWKTEYEKISNVEIQKGVTTIGKRAFVCCPKLISITIPDSVTFIGYRAFAGCTGLKSVSVPAKAKIDDEAFPEWTCIERRT